MKRLYNWIFPKQWYVYRSWSANGESFALHFITPFRFKHQARKAIEVDRIFLKNTQLFHIIKGEAIEVEPKNN